MKFIGIFKKVLEELFSPIKMLIIYLPGRLGILIRRKYYRQKGRINLGIGVKITGINKIKFGSNVSIMDFSYIYSHGGGVDKYW